MIQALRNALFDALGAGGRVLRKHFGRARVSFKGKGNLVTQADRESEEVILRLILKRFPDHGYLTEERPSKRLSGRYVWVIDPLDGTANFAHGYPVCCVSVALVENGVSILGGVYDPFRNECFWAQRGRGAFLKDRRIRVSRTRGIGRALLITGFPYDRSRRSRFYVEFYRTFMCLAQDVRRSGSAALDLAWVACGRADGFWEFKLHPWDVAAGSLLVEEAGGKVGDFSGRPWRDLSSMGAETLATNGTVHRDMLGVFSRLKGSRARTGDRRG